MRDLSPVIFRGERDGKLKALGGWRNPYFFAERYDQAALYAGHLTIPVAAVLQGTSALDLTTLDRNDPVHCRLMADLTAEFNDWTCRCSGEPTDAWSLVESGALYDYEGTGSAERWNTLLRLALDEFDAVRVLDCTDGTQGQAVPVWVVRDRANIREATFGEHLAALLSEPSVATVRPWADLQKWLERDHPGLLERINRLRIVDDDYQLAQLSNAMPAQELAKVAYPHGTGAHLAVWRAMPNLPNLLNGADIRPGDWVALEPAYAALHQRQQELGEQGIVKTLTRVSPDDVYWAGTDHQEFFFLPQAFRIQASSVEAYLRALTSEQICILCDGEEARITRHAKPIDAIRQAVLGSFDSTACGEYHGPDHWARVSAHSAAVARSLGVDPLVPYLFALVHDSQRLDDGTDPEHGPRAAQFVLDNKDILFGFLRADDHAYLVDACKDHSAGMTEAAPVIQACWDADRLDLWRVGIEPSPEYLCTPYARRMDVIDDAQSLLMEWPRKSDDPVLVESCSL